MLLAALALVFAASLTPAARAEESIPTAAAGEAAPAAAEQPSEPVQQADPGPVPVDPAPQPDPQPQPEPTPLPQESQVPADTPAAPAEGQPAVPDRGGDGSNRDAPSQHTSPSSQPVPTSFTAAAQVPVTGAGPSDAAPATTAPLGWDVYDDDLFAETLDGDGGAGGLGGALPPSIGGLTALGASGSAVERNKHHGATPASHADPMSGGGSGPGGSGPGQGPSLGLFGAAGGSSAGMALLTLLGMACGWLALAPDRQRAFLTSTATWRLSNYVPPIERPG
jgi:outer membrane biosynthesis protein TonB